jgi:hypothetical protein
VALGRSASWRKFIGNKDTQVLPFFGGHRVLAKDRSLRVAEPPARQGWYRFEIEGRSARVMEAAEPALAGLAKVRGHLVGDVIFPGGGGAGARPETVFFPPEDEPALFASCTCYRWHGGEVVFGEVDFDSEIEEQARAAFEERRGLEGVKGVPAPLRAAFGWATLRRASAVAGVPCSVGEARPFLAEIAEGGAVAAEAVLERLEELRHGRRVVVAGGRAAVRVKRMVQDARHGAEEATLANAPQRAEAALDAAGAHLRGTRRLGTQLEVRFFFDTEHFVAVVDALTLQVVDAGICLVDHRDGHRGDEELTLDSLPSAIREAMELGALVITRR